ncbi:mannan endo-1,4-beta-mannosidase 2-like [Hibiscus syriacus]|uniref:mannan endo-1,4-beta-mannosidase 2-like n=1 Tax=Hibiscus syriacus TaxID=106335 RepID=UPI001924E0DC|nr:mannan endo-1,4-beta-mannosidase 2-like [Hibiscus syriacus]
MTNLERFRASDAFIDIGQEGQRHLVIVEVPRRPAYEGEISYYIGRRWLEMGCYTQFLDLLRVWLLFMSYGDLKLSSFPRERRLSFVERNGTHFFLDGKPLFVNGWNSYWLMSHSVEENTRPKVSAMLQAGARMGFTVCRTWAFNDGGYNALQISPGQFDERVFKALDYVIAEARQHRVRLLLSLVNNLHPYGGKTQYVNWAWQEGIGLSSSNDSFFYDPSIRKYFKNYVLVSHRLSNFHQYLFLIFE